MQIQNYSMKNIYIPVFFGCPLPFDEILGWSFLCYFLAIFSCTFNDHFSNNGQYFLLPRTKHHVLFVFISNLNRPCRLQDRSVYRTFLFLEAQVIVLLAVQESLDRCQRRCSAVGEALLLYSLFFHGGKRRKSLV